MQRFKARLILTLAVLALAATLTMSNVIGSFASNPAETTPMQSLSSPADSLAWTTTQVVSTASTGWCYSPSLAVGSDGVVHVACQDDTDYGFGGDYDIIYKKSIGGTDWTALEVLSIWSTSDSENPSLAVGSDGTVHVAWDDETDYGGSGADEDIFYKRWVPGTGWTVIEVLSTESTGNSRYPSLTVGPDGTVHIAWEDTTNYGGAGSDKDIFYKKCVPGTGWTTTEVVSTASTATSEHPSLAVGFDGSVHIAWHDVTDYGGSGTDYDIFYKRRVVGADWTATEVVSTESTFQSSEPSLAVGSDGTVHIAWQDYTDYGGSGGDGDIFYKKWVSGTGWTTTEVVSTESTSITREPSLAVDSDGTVHIAWDDWTDYGGAGIDYDIFYKRRVVGADWTAAEVVSTESTGNSYNPSLAVGSDGTVHIAWQDYTDYAGSGTNGDIFYKRGEKANAYLVVRGTDNRIYYRTCSFDLWGDWKVVPSGFTCDSPAAAVYAGRLYMVVRGMDGSSLWFGSIDLSDDSFSGWAYISGSTPSKPTLVCWNDAKILVLVVRGTDNHIYYRLYSFISEEWTYWVMVPTGTTCDSPAAAIMDNYLHLVVRGMTGGLYHQQFTIIIPIYPGWTKISGDTPSAPTLVNNYKEEGDFDYLFLVVRGMNDGIYQAGYSQSLGWTSYSTWPGSTIDAIGVTAQPPYPRPGARLHLAVRGTTGHLYHGMYDLHSYSFGWTLIDGATLSPPTLTS